MSLKCTYNIPTLPLVFEIETKEILKQLSKSRSALAELKGFARVIPNEAILISTLTLQEAKDSSAVENIVTTHDELYKADLNAKDYIVSASTKEVLNYREAIQIGFSLVRAKGLLTNSVLKQIQERLEGNRAGFRTTSGTTLKDSQGNVVYTPPQDSDTINNLMTNLERFINDEGMADLDPLIKIAIIHHQFESIHPFYDGNGRTGRIMVILYLVANGLLDLPILYLSRYITHNKGDYYRLLQAIRDKEENIEEWHNWILFILKGIEETSLNTIKMIRAIDGLMREYKGVLRPLFGKQYKHELLNNLFFHPYTKIEFIQRDMQVARNTASKYLDMIVKTGLVEKVKVGKSNYYFNTKLIDLFLNYNSAETNNTESIESISKTEQQ
ncbi:MAG: Fic family protein [Bacteroidaceae bacterium]|nr:Fic family protein [Bacteroidaceae bacterium]